MVGDGPGPATGTKAGSINWQTMKGYKLVDSIWGPDARGYPPHNVCLSDAWVYIIIKTQPMSTRGHNWPFNFEKSGNIWVNQIPSGQTVWIAHDNKLFFPVYKGHYILCGGACAKIGHQLLGDMRVKKMGPNNCFTFGSIPVPLICPRKNKCHSDLLRCCP